MMDDDLIHLELTMSRHRVKQSVDHAWLVEQNPVEDNRVEDSRNEELKVSDYHRLERCLDKYDLKRINRSKLINTIDIEKIRSTLGIRLLNMTPTTSTTTDTDSRHSIDYFDGMNFISTYFE